MDFCFFSFLFLRVYRGLYGKINPLPPGSEERRACAAQRASRAARALRALGGMGGSRDGGGGPRNLSPPSPEALSDPSGAFFVLFCRVWGVVVGRNSLGKNAPHRCLRGHFRFRAPFEGCSGVLYGQKNLSPPGPEALWDPSNLKRKSRRCAAALRHKGS